MVEHFGGKLVAFIFFLFLLSFSEVELGFFGKIYVCLLWVFMFFGEMVMFLFDPRDKDS